MPRRVWICQRTTKETVNGHGILWIRHTIPWIWWMRSEDTPSNFMCRNSWSTILKLQKCSEESERIVWGYEFWKLTKTWDMKSYEHRFKETHKDFMTPRTKLKPRPGVLGDQKNRRSLVWLQNNTHNNGNVGILVKLTRGEFGIGQNSYVSDGQLCTTFLPFCTRLSRNPSDKSPTLYPL